MGGIVDKAIEVGTLGIVKDASGTKQAKKDAYNASQRQLATLREGQRMGREDLIAGFNPALNDLNTGFGDALATLRAGQASAEQPLMGAYNQGNQAAQLEAALSGALGPQAQAEAFANYQESPELAYMREQGEKAVMRNAAAQGMSLSGSVLDELNRRGTGYAMQGFGDTMARLNSIASRGQNAGNNIATLRNSNTANIANAQMGLGQGLAGYRMQQGQNLANISTGNAAQQAQIHGQLGVANANAALSQGQMGYGLLGKGIGAFMGAM